MIERKCVKEMHERNTLRACVGQENDTENARNDELYDGNRTNRLF
jgi:hypothetical protein